MRLPEVTRAHIVDRLEYIFSTKPTFFSVRSRISFYRLNCILTPLTRCCAPPALVPGVGRGWRVGDFWLANIVSCAPPLASDFMHAQTLAVCTPPDDTNQAPPPAPPPPTHNATHTHTLLIFTQFSFSLEICVEDGKVAMHKVAIRAVACEWYPAKSLRMSPSSAPLPSLLPKYLIRPQQHRTIPHLPLFNLSPITMAKAPSKLRNLFYVLADGAKLALK